MHDVDIVVVGRTHNGTIYRETHTHIQNQQTMFIYVVASMYAWSVKYNEI